MTLWVYCFWLEHADCVKNNRDSVVFTNVEKRVIEIAKVMTEFTIPSEQDNG